MGDTSSPGAQPDRDQLRTDNSEDTKYEEAPRMGDVHRHDFQGRPWTFASTIIYCQHEACTSRMDIDRGPMNEKDFRVPGIEARLTAFRAACLQQQELQAQAVEKAERTKQWQTSSPEAEKFQRKEIRRHELTAAKHRQLLAGLNMRIAELVGDDPQAVGEFLRGFKEDVPEHRHTGTSFKRPRLEQRKSFSPPDGDLGKNDRFSNSKGSQKAEIADRKGDIKRESPYVQPTDFDLRGNSNAGSQTHEHSAFTNLPLNDQHPKQGL